jgi:hypothetical protein
MKFHGTLTPETLMDEYNSWLLVNGHARRNADDIRFGQHIWNKYGNKGQSFPDLFYQENTATAYKIANEALYYG